MNYIGSKLSLLDEIRAMLARHGVRSGTFCDVFSGTSVVAQMARLDGFTVVANDWQAYSHVLQQAFLETQGYPTYARLLAAEPDIRAADAGRTRPTFGLGPDPGRAEAAVPLRRVLAWLEELEPVEGRFFEAYCEGGAAGRAYFSRENGARCEAIRGRIAEWRADGLLDDAEHAVLVASLLETMDLLANTASVYGAYLKQVKKTARAPLTLRLPRLAPADGRPHQACNEDAVALAARLPAIDVLYLDPPYNQRQYNANYHVLETIARWDLHAFEPRGKTGLRPGADQRSRFCSRREVEAAFRELIGRARARHVLVSYNDEGLLPEATLRAILTEKAAGGPTEFHTLAYKRFRADVDHEARRYKGDEVREFLFWATVGPA